MKIQIIAEIEGNFLLTTKVSAKLYPYDFEIFEEKGKRYISITKPIKDFEDVAPKLSIKDNMSRIETTKEEAYYDMVQWLYYIEAMGAFNFEIKKIHIDELEVRWICETEDERGRIPFTSFKRNRVQRIPKRILKNTNLSNIVIFRRQLPNAHIPYSYYRQAQNFFHNNDYYFAFINFFMMLEFLFAKGQFHKRKMTENFMKSELLELCILRALKMFKSNDESGQNYTWLRNECEKRHKNLDFEGIVYILIEYRGILSHATEKSKTFLQNSESLRPIAFFISFICFLLCGYTQVFCCSSAENKRKEIEKRIKEMKAYERIK